MTLPYRKSYYATHPLLLWHHLVQQPLKMFWQRGRRGWSVQDAWSADAHLASVISGMADHIQQHGSGYPSELVTRDEWCSILDKISEGFKAHLDLFEMTYLDSENAESERYALEFRYKRGMSLFVQWFEFLWD